MRKLFSVLSLAVLALAASGCSATITAGQNQATVPPFAASGVTLGADVATVELLKGVKPADRAATAQVLFDVGKAIQAAATTPADFTAINAVVAKRLIAWDSPYAPLVLAMAQQVLADAQAQAVNQSPQAAALIKAAGLGIQFGAQGFITQ